jgi:hypothetical protein
MKSEGLTVVNCSTARMKKNQNIFILPPLFFVLIVPRSSQYDPSAEFTLNRVEGLRAGLRDISAIRRLFNDAVSDLPLGREQE